MSSVYTVLKCHDPGIQEERVGIVRQRIGRSGGTQGMYTEPVYIGVDAHLSPVMLYDLLVYRRVVQMLGENLCRIVLNWAK